MFSGSFATCLQRLITGFCYEAGGKQKILFHLRPMCNWSGVSVVLQWIIIVQTVRILTVIFFVRLEEREEGHNGKQDSQFWRAAV